ncbi:FtsX-like permease family protein [Candidatus Poribacteria bacterium]
MTSWTLATRSLRFYWRTHLGVLLGVALSTAILVGALVVGDSVQYTLKTLALSRLGEVQLALASQGRYFRAELADDLASELNVATAPVLQMQGIAANGDGSARVNRSQVLGVDERFWALLSAGESNEDRLSGDEVIVNERLAEQIGVRVGDDVLLRVEKTSILPSDAPMSMGEDSVALRMTVKAIASDSGSGRFSLQASQIAPFNAFVSIERLQERLELPGRANMLLMGGDADPGSADRALQENWELADADLELREIPEQNVIELRTNRIFLDPPAANAAIAVMPETVKILTYFVNEIRRGERTTPYSIVTAIDSPTSHQSPVTSHLDKMSDDGVLINTWLAEDLQASVGDTLELTYLVFGPMRKLEERKSSFRVHAILPLEGDAVDPELMPPFPGVYDAEDSRDWKPGIPIDLKKIRDKDEDYWDDYRGTPKLFVTLEAGQRMWGNRFGDLTAVRYPISKAMDSGKLLSQVKAKIRDQLDPASVGLFFRPVREQALTASAEAMDFGQLFLGLSFFLIAAALMLTGLLFVFGIEQRTEEMGTLMAVGFPARQVRRMFLLEGGALALVGGLVGALCGMLYTKVVLFALSTVWQDAVRTTNLRYHAEPITLIVGTAAGMIIALLAIWVTSRRQAKHPARELLTSGGGFEERIAGKYARSNVRFILGLLVTVISVAAALIILFLADSGSGTKAAGAFFGAGALLLIGGFGLSYILLTRCSSWIAGRGLTGMGVRNSARRWGRSLVTIGLLACGSFLVIAVGANRHDAMKDADKRWSGTGGFALYGESTLPVLHDLNSEDAQEAYGLDSDALKNAEFVPFRVHDGDDASCLNLNRAQTPRLLGVRPEDLRTRRAFTFTETIDGSDDPWSLLRKNTDNTVNAIGDQNTISWAIGKSVGDILTYKDERGQTFDIKIVGAIANSILQGSFLILEDEFIRRFPSESGYRTFLIDAPPNNAPHVSRTLTRALQDAGLELTPAARRLEEFNTIQNTYLSIFQSLGGLALLLGSLGLGIVVLRNVMERRGELALLRAVGFRNRSLQWLVLSEHWLLLLLGLVCGVIAGLVAVLPALRSPGADIPYTSLAVTLFAILSSGVLWTWLAARLALRGPLLNALRNE